MILNVVLTKNRKMLFSIKLSNLSMNLMGCRMKSGGFYFFILCFVLFFILGFVLFFLF